jgi:hypothetical protein
MHADLIHSLSCLNFNGKIQDIPMRWRANAANPTISSGRHDRAR